MLNSKIVDPDLLESFKRTWQEWPKEFSHAQWQDPSWREPFELLSAALIYSYNGLINFPEDRLHSTVRSVCDWDRVWKSVLSGDQPPSFTSQEGRELFATMHFASSSFRICTALLLIIESLITRVVEESLAKFLRKDSDWNRDELYRYLKQATSLGCCKASQNTALTTEMALAMVVAHRDEFAHGEEGRGRRWREKRGTLFSELYPCRIFQAQLSLIDLGRDELAKLLK